MTALDRLAAALSRSYRLERELGAGGMATVYLAQDLRHDRQVAIKVLRPELAAVIGAERFLHEIKTTANLQHPPILPLFDSGVVEGTVFYAMPFVEGESLRDRIAREKQLPVAEAVRIATEVASALDYAHRKGVIHRDIKPENILLHDGQALVADFGIALAATTTGGSRMTETGMSLGTPHYMSPEQAMGEREINARTDIYALGCVLYEMLTGEPPFTGPTAQAIVARVMTESPRGVTLQRRTVPSHVESAVLTALEKLPADRFGSAAEFAAALNTPGSGASRHATAAARGFRLGTGVLAAAGLAMLAAVAMLGTLLNRPSAPPSQVVRLTMTLPDSLGLRAVGTLRLAISPDGRRVAWVGGMGGLPGIVVRDFDEPTPRFLAGTEGALAPFFSPDGETIGFFIGRSALGSLKAIPATGGAVQTIVARNVEPWGGDWTEDGMIYFTRIDSRVGRVAASGGEVTVVSTIDSTIPGVTEHDFVDVLPNGKGAIVQLWRGGPGQNMIGILNLATGVMDTLGTGGFARYLRTGHVLFATADGRLHLVPFDADRLRVTGRPSVVLEGVPMDNLSGAAQFAVSETGVLVYQTSLGVGQSYPAWVNRSGEATVIDSGWTVETIDGIALSPDGRRVAITHATPEGVQIWIKTLSTGPFTRLTFSGGGSDRPDWSPDGQRIAFLSDAGDGGRQAWVQRADGGSTASLLATWPGRMDEVDFSPDGRWLIGRTFGSGGGTRKLLILEIGVDTAMRMLLDGPADMYAPVLSPDSRWLAYTSEESGQAEVYVRPFPEVASARWQVSVGGGREPLWSRDGQEIFYRTDRGEVVAVGVTTTPGFASENPVVLFTDMAALPGVFRRNYDVADDGRFLMVRAGAGASGELNVIFNWFSEIEQRFGKR
ncbi:MAG TPA: protein kinase [Gemmatimonadales bacterium]|nr:protein kinase [Gemmatimonadales bacterium]